MTATTTIAISSLLLSVASTFISIASYWRTRKIQAYEYATRLQLDNENIIGGGGQHQAFGYSADIVNAGLKPVELTNVFIDYGGISDGTYYKFNVVGLCYLAPGERRVIDFSLSQDDYRQVLSKYSLPSCLIRLRVCYVNPTGGKVEATRNLMGLGPSETTMYAQRGDAIV